MRRFYCLLLLAACSRPRSVPVSVPDGSDRRVHIYVPDVPPGPTGLPLVVMLHGAKSTPDRTERGTGWTRLAHEEGFIVAYPEGIGRSWNDGRSDAVPAAAKGADDIAWLGRVFDDLIARYPVDPHRIVLTGASNGGMLGWRWMCEGRGRASVFAPVISGLPAPSAASCAPTPVATLVIQSGADPIVPITGGTVGRDRGAIASTEDALAIARKANGCPDTPTDTGTTDAVPNDQMSALRATWSACTGPDVAHILLQGAGHLWPGGRQVLPADTVGHVSPDIDGAREIWTFAERTWSTAP